MSKMKILLVLFCGLTWTGVARSSSDPAELSRQARQAMLAHRYEEAIRLFQQLLVLLPHEPGVRFNLGLALHSASRFRESIQQLERIRAAEETNPNYWLLLGLDYLKRNEPWKAIEPLGKALTLDPCNATAQLELASAFLESNQLARAEKAFLRLTNEQPGLSKAWQGLALAQIGMSEQAYRALETAAPDSSFHYALAGISEAERGNSGADLKLYRKALAAQPCPPWLQSELTALLAGAAKAENFAEHGPAHELQAGNLENFLETYLNSTSAEALFWTSRTYAALAKRSLVRLAALPPSAEQHEMLALAYGQVGRRSESVAEWREAVRMEPQDQRLQGRLAEALWLSREYDEAGKILEFLVSGDPGRAEWQYELGDTLFSLGRPAQALPHLQQAVTLAPMMLAAQASLAKALLRMGNPAAAIPHLEKAIAIDQDGSLYFQLATAYRKVGKAKLADRVLEQEKEKRTARDKNSPLP